MLTSLNDALLRDRRLATIRALPFHSSLDKTRIGAWLVCPPSLACHDLPLILMIHGGPYGYDDPTWNAEDQLLAAAGYAILHVNYRGSLGYGFPFADRIARDYPNPSYVDLMSGVDAAVAAGIADQSRLFVAGSSAGGAARGLDRRQDRPLQGGRGGEAGHQRDQRRAAHRSVCELG